MRTVLLGLLVVVGCGGAPGDRDVVQSPALDAGPAGDAGMEPDAGSIPLCERGERPARACGHEIASGCELPTCLPSECRGGVEARNYDCEGVFLYAGGQAFPVTGIAVEPWCDAGILRFTANGTEHRRAWQDGADPCSLWYATPAADEWPYSF